MQAIQRNWPWRTAQAGADEIVLLDITATAESRNTLLDTVRRTARQLFIPFTVGGGIRSLDDAAAVLDCGADKVAMNSAAIAHPTLITRVAERYGSQAVVVAIDARQRTPATWEVYVWGGRKADRARRETVGDRGRRTGGRRNHADFDGP